MGPKWSWFEFEDDRGAVPKIWKDFVYGAGQLLVEREVVESVPKLAASSPLSTNSTLGMTLTAGDGSSSYAVDIRTDSGYTNLVTGIVPDAQGKFSIPESAVFAGETNFLRIRGEGPQPSRYSAAATVAIDSTVDSSSPNQVKWLSVSRSGTQVTVRWQLQQSNGKKFKVYFTRADTGQAVLLTQFPLASTSTNITFLDQALASPCGLFSISQTLADGSQETLPSTGAGLPSPGGGDVFGGNQGGCDPDPPPPPGPSGPTWVNTFHHRDHLGSLRVTTDAAGWMLSGHDFYPFGMEVAASGQAAGGPSRMKFTGHERDDLTGLDYMKARYSGWFQASFLIPDPANDVNPRNPQSWNRYAYVRNNPINLVDPSGMNGDGVSQGEGGGGRKVHHYMNQAELYGAGGCGPGQTAMTCDTLGITLEIIECSAETADEANQKEEGKDPAASDDADESAGVSVSDAGIDLIAGFEGFSPTVYSDPVGIATIGYGHVVQEGEKFDEPMTESQGKALLRSDVESKVEPALASVAVPLNQKQVDALASFVYNVGGSAFQGSTLLRELNKGNYDAVPRELQRWTHAGGKELPGLVRRRKAEGELFAQ